MGWSSKQGNKHFALKLGRAPEEKTHLPTNPSVFEVLSILVFREGTKYTMEPCKRYLIFKSWWIVWCTLQENNISQHWKSKIMFKSAFGWVMLAPRRVFVFFVGGWPCLMPTNYPTIGNNQGVVDSIDLISCLEETILDFSQATATLRRWTILDTCLIVRTNRF